MRDDYVNIRFDSYALGDSIAWMPYVEKYRQDTDKVVLVSTFFNEIFAPVYPKIIFCQPNNLLDNIERKYIGVNVDGRTGVGIPHMEWRMIPLQRVASDLLGMAYVPIQPKVYVPDIEIPYKNYICISEHTSRKNKYWHFPNGWQDIVDYCNSIGVTVITCSKEPTKLKGVIDRTGNHSITNRSALINKAKAFIGVSSGLAWLAQGVNTPTIMISGSTTYDHETIWNGYRLSTPKGFCSGCINSTKYEFNDSLDCPENKDYECSKKITSDMVIIKLNSILEKEKYDGVND